jgi:hypothetical protein
LIWRTLMNEEQKITIQGTIDIMISMSHYLSMESDPSKAKILMHSMILQRISELERILNA